MTLQEWAALGEDEPGELVDGQLEEEEMASAIHEALVAWLIGLLHAWAASGVRLRILGSEAKLGIDARRGRKADVAVWLPDAKRPAATGVITAPPSIAIEVVTPTPRDERRDRVEKLREYAAFGVRFYWIVDPELRTFQIHELDANRAYVHRIDATNGVVECVPGCSGLVIDVDALWRLVDEVIADGQQDA